MGREVEGRWGRTGFRDRGSMKQVRAGESRRIRPGGVAGSLRQLAHGTLRSRLGLVLRRVEGLCRGGDEEREDDGDSGERVHAPPDPRWINSVGHRLPRAASRATARPRCGTDGYADQECVLASCMRRNSGLLTPAVLSAAGGGTLPASRKRRDCLDRNDNCLSLAIKGWSEYPSAARLAERRSRL